MPSPQWDGSPSRYQPNPVDDRAVAGQPNGDVYRALAAAIESVTDDIPPAVYRTLQPATRKAIRSAESALRRAAFTFVLYSPDEEPRA